MSSLSHEVVNFRNEILSGLYGVLDPPDVHHVFKSSQHGRKLDFDEIKTGTPIYYQWVGLARKAMQEVYGPDQPQVIVGVANGANRLARDITRALDSDIEAIESYKNGSNVALLSHQALEMIAINLVDFAVVVDDAGTTGGSAVPIIDQLVDAGVDRIEVFNTWQRSETLSRLDELDIVYNSLIKYPLPNFSAEECRTLDSGYCYQGVQLEAYTT